MSPARRPASARGWLEPATAAGLGVGFVLGGPLPVIARMARAELDGALAAFELASEDAATIGSAALAALRAIGIVAPVAIAFARARPARLVWAPLSVPPVVLALAFAHHGWAGARGALGLLAIGALGSAAQRWWQLRFFAAVPIALSLHPTLTVHQPHAMHLPGFGGYLAARCRAHPGERPAGLEPAMLRPAYYAVTRVGPSRWLLTGESGTSRWLTASSTGLHLGPRSRVEGNYWMGTRGAGRAWLAHRDDLVGVRWSEREGEQHGDAPGNEHGDAYDEREDLERRSLVGLRADWEIDVLDAVYEPATGDVFASELLTGGLLRIDPDGGPGVRYPLELFYLQITRGPPGELIGIGSTELVTIDAADGRVLTRRVAAMGSGGVAACEHDHAVAVTDFAGRVRLFERDAAGGYRFAAGADVPAPRRVAFSPGCERLAVASADDRTVVILRREGLAIERRYSVGPGLRGLHWRDEGQLWLVDACSVTRLRLDR